MIELASTETLTHLAHPRRRRIKDPEQEKLVRRRSHCHCGECRGCKTDKIWDERFDLRFGESMKQYYAKPARSSSPIADIFVGNDCVD